MTDPAIPEKWAILRRLESENVPVVLIGGQAVRSYGSTRLTEDFDVASRAIDIDRIIDIMYEFGYMIATASSSDSGKAIWARTPVVAKEFIEATKPGSLNFYFLNSEGDPIDVFDYVYECPVPFARLRADARTIWEDPKIVAASIDHLITMKEKCVAANRGRPTDSHDIGYLKLINEKRRRIEDENG